MSKYLAEILTSSWNAALIVPILLFLAGGLGKKLVRGENNWHRKDFYLGVDAALASISAALIHLFDIIRELNTKPEENTIANLMGCGVFIAISFFLFLVVLGIHQNWENQVNSRIGQWFWLVFFSNIIGLGLMFAFILAIKGVQ